MTRAPDILCIGSVLWDVIGRTASHMEIGSDVPGRIVRRPGGVAMNVALTLARFGLRPALLTAIGADAEGRELAAVAEARELIFDYAYVSADLPTDRYMAIEAATGLIAAIADAHSLEAAGDKILRPLHDGRLGSAEAPYAGPVVLDGNLTEALLHRIAEDPALARADLRVAPASPGKAERLQPFLTHPRGTLYLNRIEAGLLARRSFASAADAARGLLDRGVRRVLVTDGAEAAAEGGLDGVHQRRPPAILVTRVTGAGDTFMAAHIAAELRGEGQRTAFASAQEAAAAHVSGDTPL